MLTFHKNRVIKAFMSLRYPEIDFSKNPAAITPGIFDKNSERKRPKHWQPYGVWSAFFFYRIIVTEFSVQ